VKNLLKSNGRNNSSTVSNPSPSGNTPGLLSCAGCTAKPNGTTVVIVVATVDWMTPVCVVDVNPVIVEVVKPETVVTVTEVQVEL